MNKSSIIVKELSVKLQGTPVLDGISFELHHQHLAVLGPSGSGKTTLAKALAGQLFYNGEITITTGSGPESVLLVSAHNEFKNSCNLSSFYYQQRYNSTESEDSSTVIQSLSVYGEDIVDGLLGRFHLHHCKHKPLLQLSNGEQKKFQLIQALLQCPDVLILDQPFTGLDKEGRGELHQIIDHISTAVTVIIITTHNEIPDSITHIARLDNGRLTEFSPKENYTHKVAGTVLGPSGSLFHDIPFSSFTNAVSMKQVSLSFGEKTILKDINWQVAAGEKWVVTGANGAGKSTLLSFITGDNPQAYGKNIYLFDKKRGTGESIWDIKKMIGYLSPELHWYFDQSISVFETIASGFFDTMGLYQQLSSDQFEAVEACLEYFKLEHVKDNRLSDLSTGLIRMVLLARAFVKNPPLLILDEPCQGLDQEQTSLLIHLINQLCAGSNRTLIYVSHYITERPDCITKKLELDKGQGTVAEIENKIIAA
ncbi:MAG TPA: ATP-binding cassette domain-containing protein [Flavisolibacter sp.]|nr:ATP-binding cassette domain-containing protein [Flavisolibacter sp.]